MSLETATHGNLQYVIQQIKEKLNIVNAALIRPEDYRLEKYDELLAIYQFMQKRQGTFTMMEIEGILEELRELKS